VTSFNPSVCYSKMAAFAVTLAAFGLLSGCWPLVAVGGVLLYWGLVVVNSFEQIDIDREQGLKNDHRGVLHPDARRVGRR